MHQRSRTLCATRQMRLCVRAVALQGLLVLLTLAAVTAQGTSGCSLELSTGSVAFDYCVPAQGVGSDFYLFWTVLPSPTNATQPAGTTDGMLIRWGMNTSSKGYVSLGFPPFPEPDSGLMVGAYAATLSSCKGCLTGAQLQEWYLGGTASGQMQAANSLKLYNITAEATPAGGMVGVFVIEMPPERDPADIDLIYAAGGIYADGAMRKHETYGAGTFNLEEGSVDEPEEFSIAVSAYVAAHLWLQIISWGFLIPVGIVMARCMKHKDPWWFTMHRAIQSVGLLMALAGLALGFVISGGWNGKFAVHRNLGFAATVLGFLQLPALFLRPTQSSKYRRAWNLYHWWQGRAAAVLAIANIYYGLINIEAVGTGAWAAYTAVFAVIFCSAVGLDGFAYLQLPPPSKTPGLQKPLPSRAALNSMYNTGTAATSTVGSITPGNTTPAFPHSRSEVQLVP